MTQQFKDLISKIKNLQHPTTFELAVKQITENIYNKRMIEVDEIIEQMKTGRTK